MDGGDKTKEIDRLWQSLQTPPQPRPFWERLRRPSDRRTPWRAARRRPSYAQAPLPPAAPPPSKAETAARQKDRRATAALQLFAQSRSRPALHPRKAPNRLRPARREHQSRRVAQGREHHSTKTQQPRQLCPTASPSSDRPLPPPTKGRLGATSEMTKAAQSPAASSRPYAGRAGSLASSSSPP